MVAAAVAWTAYDKALAHAAEGALLRADVRERFEQARGRVFEDEALWEVWSQLFLQWVAFEYPGDGGPPYALGLLTASSPAVTRREAEWLVAWANSQRVLARFEDSNLVLDLLRGGVYELVTAQPMHGVERGDIAELRVAGHAGVVCAAPHMLFHERAAREVVEAHCARAKLAGVTPESTMNHLAGLLAKVARYHHMPPAKVYELDRALADRTRRAGTGA